MNIATEIGLCIFAGFGFVFLVFFWFVICWNIADKYEEKVPYIGLYVYYAPLVLAGLLFLCYGLVVQPKTQPKEETVQVFTKEQLQQTLEQHIKDLVEHYKNVDHKQVFHPETKAPGVYVTHLEFVDLNGIVNLWENLRDYDKYDKAPDNR